MALEARPVARPSWDSSETPKPRRTATGLLEGYVASAREMGRIAHFRSTGDEPLEGDEARVVAMVRRHATGLEQAFAKWAEIRIDKEQ